MKDVLNSRLVLIGILFVFLVTACEEENDFDWIELEICGDVSAGSYAWDYENCEEFPQYVVESCAAAGQPEYDVEDTVLFHYSIQNLDTIDVTFQLSGTPGVLFEIETLGWQLGGVTDSTAWELTLAPQELFSYSAEAVLTDSVGEAPPPDYYPFTASLAGCTDPDYDFPVDYEIILTSNVDPDTAYVPEFNLSVCWRSELMDTLEITYQLLEANQTTLRFYAVDGSLNEVIVNEEDPAGHNFVIYNTTGLPGGAYGIELVSGSYRREVRFEL